MRAYKARVPANLKDWSEIARSMADEKEKKKEKKKVPLDFVIYARSEEEARIYLADPEYPIRRMAEKLCGLSDINDVRLEELVLEPPPWEEIIKVLRRSLDEQKTDAPLSADTLKTAIQIAERYKLEEYAPPHRIYHDMEGKLIFEYHQSDGLKIETITQHIKRFTFVPSEGI